jgi:ankyrin repeat domain-containing protein 50
VLSLSIAQGVSDITQQLDAKKLDDDREAIIRWLSTTDPSTNFHAARKKCQPGSGRWLLERDEFKSWQAAQNTLLWLHGIREYHDIHF